MISDQMSKAPVYNQDRTRRVVYRPNKLWAAQEYTGQPSSKTFDPWRDLHRPTGDRVLALVQAGIKP